MEFTIYTAVAIALVLAVAAAFVARFVHRRTINDPRLHPTREHNSLLG
jgi:hypothetical protein